MDEITVRDVEQLMRGWNVDAELAACRRLLGICQAFLPNGWLHDTVRLVAEGGNAEAAWKAMEEMTR